MVMDFSSAITIGNFDGCHLGHQRLIQRTLQEKSRLDCNKSVVLTFDPHPTDFFNNTHKNPKLFTLQQKIFALKELGIDDVHIIPFNQELREMSATDFFYNRLLHQFKAKAIIVGRNFRFGVQQKGNAALLKELCVKENIQLQLIDEFKIEDNILSSTLIRQELLNSGDMCKIRNWLGRPYLLQGIVIHGQKLGRTLGYPTANLALVEQIIPARGVYAAFASVDSIKTTIFKPNTRNLYKAMVNIGYKPSVQSSHEKLTIEAHLITNDPSEKLDLYDQALNLYFISRIRDEMTFTIEQLKQQLHTDKLKAYEILENEIKRHQ